MRKENIMTDIDSISKQLGLPVKKILDMLWLIRSGPVENNSLLRGVGVSKNVLNLVKQRLASYLQPPSTETSLNPNGLEVVSTFLPENYAVEEKMWDFLKNFPEFEKITSLLEDHSHLRPEPERKFDQFTATAETTAKRAVLMNFFADIRGKRVLCLGDDDFVSVAVNSFKTAKRVEALDIDHRVLDGIKQIDTGISCTEYDARRSLPKAFTGKFDVVFTDPPYTPEGVSLFLSRAIEALDTKGNQAARVYFCYGNSDRAKERFLPVYSALTDTGLMIRWVFDKLNRYTGAESIGSASSLFICDITPKTKPIIHGEFREQIYTTNT